MKLYEQIERGLQQWLAGEAGKPWKRHGVSHRWDKKAKLRAERRKAHRDPECVEAYRRYKGWEY